MHQHWNPEGEAKFRWEDEFIFIHIVVLSFLRKFKVQIPSKQFNILISSSEDNSRLKTYIWEPAGGRFYSCFSIMPKKLEHSFFSSDSLQKTFNVRSRGQVAPRHFPSWAWPLLSHGPPKANMKGCARNMSAPWQSSGGKLILALCFYPLKSKHDLLHRVFEKMKWEKITKAIWHCLAESEKKELGYSHMKYYTQGEPARTWQDLNPGRSDKLQTGAGTGNKKYRRNPCMYGQLTFYKRAKKHSTGKEQSLQQMLLKTLEKKMQKNEIGPLSYMTHKN